LATLIPVAFQSCAATGGGGAWALGECALHSDLIPWLEAHRCQGPALTGTRRTPSRCTLYFFNGLLTGLTVVPLAVGGVARVVALLAGVGLVVAMGMLV